MGTPPRTIGCEVYHLTHGRGTIVDESRISPDGTEEVPVLFYFSKEIQNIPVVTLQPAAEVANADVSAGTDGLAVTVDDGFFTINIEPDGRGSGFDVTVRAGNAIIDSAKLDWSDFIEKR